MTITARGPRCLRLSLALLGVWSLVPTPPAHTAPDRATRSAAAEECVVATVHPLASDAGVEAFRQGGNAVDAAIAAALTLGVVDTHNSGIGGGCFILIRYPDGRLLAIDGREMAPAGATPDMYVRDGKVVPGWSTTGPLAVAVPGALAAYSLAIDEAGERSLADLLRPAAKLAADGFPVGGVLANNLKEKASELSQFTGSREVMFRADGETYRKGETLKQPDLADTYRQIAGQGIDWFYRGPFARRVSQWMKRNGGLITATDFDNYRPKRRTPVVSSYRGTKIIGFPPPSSGGIHVAQILQILEPFELGELGKRDPAAATHLIVEAMKLAFADRAHWLGDADFADVPLGLVDPNYAESLAAKIDPDRSTDVAAHGDPLTFDQKLFERHTTHIAAADSAGYWVAITATLNTHFGSKVIVPGTGVMLNNQMDDFSSQPGVPNSFGLIGAENNSIAPGKRPLSSMSPTLVLDQEGRPLMTAGAAGGPKIITQVLLSIIRHFDFGQPIAEAVARPRFHHQWRPDFVQVESDFDSEIVAELSRRGHVVEKIHSGGVTQAIVVDDAGSLVGVSDPRVPGKVARIRRQPVPAGAEAEAASP